MSTKSTRFPRRTRTQWKQIIERFDSTQQTVTDFCQEQEISLASFYKWRNQFRLATVDSEQPLFVQMNQVGHLVEPATPHWDMELDLGNGVVLRMQKAC